MSIRAVEFSPYAQAIHSAGQTSIASSIQFSSPPHSGSEDPFLAIRQRLQHSESRMRGRGADYLYYCLIDNAIDLIFPQMEILADRIEALELEVFDRPERQALDDIHRLKRELVLLN